VQAEYSQVDFCMLVKNIIYSTYSFSSINCRDSRRPPTKHEPPWQVLTLVTCSRGGDLILNYTEQKVWSLVDSCLLISYNPILKKEVLLFPSHSVQNARQMLQMSLQLEIIWNRMFEHIWLDPYDISSTRVCPCLRKNRLLSILPDVARKCTHSCGGEAKHP